MKSKPYQLYNNPNNGYSGMNNQNPPPPAPPQAYTGGQSPYIPSYPPPPPPPSNYPMPPNYVYPIYAEQVQPGYPNYWQAVQYPQYPYPPMPPVQLPMKKPHSGPSQKSSQKVSLNYNPPKKAQKPSIVYECKTCDKTFNGARQHETHMSLHKKCPECDFEASKKVLNLHIEECHSKSINKNKFISLNTPEEIEKWIAERKKNYPTDANIQRKKKELQEKMERGEIVPVGKRGAERPSENPRKKKQKRNNNNNNNNNNNENDNSSKDNSLGLISAYNSESDNENGTSVNENSKTVSTNNNEKSSQNQQKKKKDKSEILCKYYLHGHCSRGDKCQFKHERKSDNKNKPNNNNNNNQKDNKNKKSLLRMLLDKEIRNEKNKIFQCIRYIINNNFFMEDSVNENKTNDSEGINNDNNNNNSSSSNNNTNLNNNSSEENDISTSISEAIEVDLSNNSVIKNES